MINKRRKKMAKTALVVCMLYFLAVASHLTNAEEADMNTGDGSVRNAEMADVETKDKVPQ